MLNAIDRLWQEHLYAMDGCARRFTSRLLGKRIRSSNTRSEAYEMFEDLMANIKGEILHNLFRSTTNLRRSSNSSCGSLAIFRSSRRNRAMQPKEAQLACAPGGRPVAVLNWLRAEP